MSSTKDARIVRTRQALRDALLSLIERKPLQDVTIREIAAEAGIHYATFFRHHETKEALLNDIAADQINQVVELMLPVVYGSDRHSVHVALCSYVDEHRSLWTILLTGGAAETLKSELIRLCKAPGEDRIPSDNEIPAELVVIGGVSVIVETLAWWLAQPKGSVSIETLARYLDRMIYSALESRSNL
ncbi:TetR/AcrR family transcriptional regulator [Halioxenophilus sp. WMMB6]|uniref:TetR/AcrR family transcriptional regulator n=1 Tax=Halioxenophilus sp. WMMB6 TaxID=3073815 RepID=UPI00295EF08D|nr:TetR/AcrR family transcriptional regulator [Halioxenophilus sp. WMMB6]